MNIIRKKRSIGMLLCSLVVLVCLLFSTVASASYPTGASYTPTRNDDYIEYGGYTQHTSELEYMEVLSQLWWYNAVLNDYEEVDYGVDWGYTTKKVEVPKDENYYWEVKANFFTYSMHYWHDHVYWDWFDSYSNIDFI